MNDEFDPSVLRNLAQVLDNAGFRVAELTARFESGAAAPENAAIIGSTDAAAGYAGGLNGCLRGLSQLQASLAGLGQKMEVAAVYYERNEAENTRAAGTFGSDTSAGGAGGGRA